jgi:hypothetical protein
MLPISDCPQVEYPRKMLDKTGDLLCYEKK